MKLTVNEKEPLWAKKYLPNTVEEIILPKKFKQEIMSSIKSGEVQHMLLYGTPGRGKTALAKAIASDMDASVMFINSSLDTSINVIRNRVVQFVSSKSILSTSSRKVVILDECEQASKETLNSLKGLLEEFSRNAVFLFTTNHVNQMPDALKSRTNMVSFDVVPDDKAEIVGQIFQRSIDILENEGVEYNSEDVAKAVKNTFPDFRSLLNTLQKASVSGTLDSSVLKNDSSYDELIEMLINSNWSEMRKWASAYYQYFDFGEFFKALVESDQVDNKTLPIIVIHSADYDYKSTVCSDKQLNVVAYLTEVMTSL